MIIGVVSIDSVPVLSLSQEQIRIQASGAEYFNVEDISICSNLTIANGSIDRFLQVLAYQESRGDPKAQARTSTASGKYQYINGTWRARESLYGPSGQYSRALLAPEEVQDAVAYIEYTQKFRELDSDIFKLAVSHFLPAANSDPTKLDQVPSGNSITPRQYAERLIQNMGNGIGGEIPLLYGQAPEFDVWVEKVGGSAPTINSGGNSSGCSSFKAGATIVQTAKEELALGANEGDESYKKYTGGVEADWCAYFVSWVVEKAGHPFPGGPIPTVAGILAYAQNKGYYHPESEQGFTPQPGDIAIYKEGLTPYPSHVNIVISYDPSTNKYTAIGGNEGQANGKDTIKQTSWDANLPALTGFMRLP